MEIENIANDELVIKESIKVAEEVKSTGVFILSNESQSISRLGSFSLMKLIKSQIVHQRCGTVVQVTMEFKEIYYLLWRVA